MALHKWNEVKAKMTPARRARLDAEVRRDVLELELRELRQEAGKTVVAAPMHFTFTVRTKSGAIMTIEVEAPDQAAAEEMAKRENPTCSVVSATGSGRTVVLPPINIVV